MRARDRASACGGSIPCRWSSARTCNAVAVDQVVGLVQRGDQPHGLVEQSHPRGEHVAIVAAGGDEDVDAGPAQLGRGNQFDVGDQVAVVPHGPHAQQVEDLGFHDPVIGEGGEGVEREGDLLRIAALRLELLGEELLDQRLADFPRRPAGDFLGIHHVHVAAGGDDGRVSLGAVAGPGRNEAAGQGGHEVVDFLRGLRKAVLEPLGPLEIVAKPLRQARGRNACRRRPAGHPRRTSPGRRSAGGLLRLSGGGISRGFPRVRAAAGGGGTTSSRASRKRFPRQVTSQGTSNSRGGGWPNTCRLTVVVSLWISCR